MQLLLELYIGLMEAQLVNMLLKTKWSKQNVMHVRKKLFCPTFRNNYL